MASQITRKDFIEDAAFNVPSDLAKEWKKVRDEMKLVVDSTKALTKGIGASDSIPKVKQQTEQLTIAEKELIKVQNQAIVVQAKTNEQYIAEKKNLDNLNNSLKNKIALGDKDAKTVTAQNASLAQLRAALNQNIAAYGKLSSEQERNSTAGKKLLSIIQQQDKSVKEISGTLGKFQDNVGKYPTILSGVEKGLTVANPKLGGFVAGLKEAGVGALSFVGSGIGITVGAVGAGLAVAAKAVTTYFNETLSGQEKLNELSSYYVGIQETINNRFKEIGKSIVDAFTEPEGFKNLAGDILDFTSALAGFVTGTGAYSASYFSKFAVEAKKNIEIAKELAAIQNKQVKEHIKDVVDDANTEVKVRELLEKVSDKQNNTDKERLTALREARALRIEQAKGDIQLAEDDIKAVQRQIELKGGLIQKDKLISEYTDEELKSLNVNAEQIKKLGDAQVNLLNVRTTLAQQSKTFNKLETALVNEIYKAEKDRIDRLAKANDDYQKALLNGYIAVNDAIIKDSKSTLAQQQEAYDNNLVQRLQLLDIEEKAAIKAADDIARERKRQEGFDEVGIAAELEKDKALQTQKFAIEKDYINKTNDLIKGAVDGRLKLYADYGQKEIDQFKQIENLKFVETQKAFARGEITLDQYLKAAEEHKNTLDKIQVDGTTSVIEAQILSYEKLIAFIKENGGDITAAEKSLSDLRIANAQAEADKKLKIEEKQVEESKKLQEKKVQYEKQLQDELFSATQAILQNAAAAEAQRIDSHIKRIQDSAALEIAAAGDNQALKDRINNKAQADEKRLYAEKAKQQRKYAEFEKALALIQIAINTEQGASKAYAEGGVLGPVFAALVIAAGVAQAAVVASKPIPQYFKGTDNAPGGLAWVGEKGFEIVESPSGDKAITPNKPVLTYLEKGSKVYTHEESLNLIARTGMIEGGSRAVTYLDGNVVEELRSINKTIKGNSPNATTLAFNGLALYAFHKSSDAVRKRQWLAAMGSTFERHYKG